MHEVLITLVKLIAPVLSFTAEEVWQQIPKGVDDPCSVHLCLFPSVQDGHLDEELAERWKRLLTVRDKVLAALEVARKEKLIGNSLEAEIKIRANSSLYGFLLTHQEELSTLFIVSDVSLVSVGQGELGEGKELEVKVGRAPGRKCERCWNYSQALGSDPHHPTLCPRCSRVMQEAQGS